MGMPTSTFTEVQHKSNQATGSSVTVTITSATAGNILFAYGEADTTITNPSGWTLIDSTSIAGTSGVQPRNCKTWYKVAAGGETSLALSATSATIVLGGVAEINGPTGIGVHTTVTNSAHWDAPSTTLSPALGSALLAVNFFGFKTDVVLPFNSGNKGLPTPSGWYAGLRPSQIANPSGLQGVGRPFIQATGTGLRAAAAAHFGQIMASFSGSQTVGYLPDWWVENNVVSMGTANISQALHIVEFKTSTTTSGDVAQSITDTITSTGVLSRFSGASLSETVTITGTGAANRLISSSLTETATITAAGTAAHVGDDTIPVTVTITAAGNVSGSGNGSAALNVSVAISGAGNNAGSSGTGLASTAVLTATGLVSQAAGASLSEAVTILAGGMASHPGGSGVTVTSTITADGFVVSSSVNSVLNLVATILADGAVTSVPVFVFKTPSRDVPSPLNDTLFGRLVFQEGVTVLVNGGQYTQKSFPSPEEIEAADKAYLGGRGYVIDQDEKDALEAAGYGPFIEQIGGGES